MRNCKTLYIGFLTKAGVYFIQQLQKAGMKLCGLYLHLALPFLLD